MTCVSLQCQNERILTRKLLDKNKKNTLMSVGLEILFDKHFCDYASDMRRTRKRIMSSMEQKFQQQCLNNDDDPDMSETMQTDEMDRYLICKQRISSLFSEILSICNDVTTDEMEEPEGTSYTTVEPFDFDPSQDAMCIFCLNKEMIAEREMASHLSYLKEIKQRNLSREEKASSSAECKVTESYQQSLKQLSMGLNDSPSPISTPSEIQQKNTASAIQTTANALLGLPSVSDPSLFSLPMMAETLAATLLELGMQNQTADRSGGFCSDFGLEFPFYSLPGYSELPKSLSKNMVTQFFDAALSLQQNLENVNKNEEKVSGQSTSTVTPPSTTPTVVKDRSDVDVEMTNTSPAQCNNLEDANTPQKKTYSSSDLQHALRDVCDGKMGTRRASLAYGVPRSTIRNHLNKIKNYGKDVAFKMLDSEGCTSLDICSQLSLRAKQMITELKCDDFKRQAENNNAILLDNNQNVSDPFIKHALACQLEEYLANSAINSNPYAYIGPEVNNSYLLETDVQYVPNLRCALAAVQCSGMSISKASAIFNIHTEHIREALASP